MPRKKKAKEEVYHVEVITKARVSDAGEWEYFVKWAGYGSDADSWEPSDNVQQCDRLLRSFWRHVGTDDKDYDIGYETAAEESWINEEKKYFAETFAKPSKRKSAKERQKSKSSASESNVDGFLSSDEPSAKAPTKKKVSKARVVRSESESESDGWSSRQGTARPKAISPPVKERPKVPAQTQRQEVSAARGSLSIAASKAPAVRTHQEQRTNPLVRPMDLPSESVGACSLLSTKQRVAAGILPPPTGPKPLPPAPKKAFSSLSFKKNKPPALPMSQVKDTALPSTSVATPTSPTNQPTNSVDVVSSPDPMDIDQPVEWFGFDSIMGDAGPLDKSDPEMYIVPLPQKSREETVAEEFLRTVNIPALGEPLETDATVDQPGQPVIESSKPSTISKIPKKWKWSGNLFISTSESKTELLCAVSIADPSGLSNSSHANLLLARLDSLQISRLYPIMDLSAFLQACGKPQYFGRLESNEPGEEVTIDGFKHYLTNEGLAAVLPLIHDGTEVAVLLIFPTAQQKLTKVLQVPEHLLSGTPLLVVLLPFLVSTAASIGWKSIEDTQTPHSLPDKPQDYPLEKTLHQAMCLLCFPKTLLDFLNGSPTTRLYSIWPMLDQQSPGLDAMFLQHILQSTKAIPAKVEEDVRVIFISNQCLDILYTMPTLVEKRVNSPEVQFWTYGYSPTATNKRWIVQEIYPLGGIVTFTTAALMEDLIGCYQFISKIIEHPLWDCYLLPEVLAASHLLYSDKSLASPGLHCDPILDFISLGSVSVMRMPEKSQSNEAIWLSQVFHSPCINGDELLEAGLGTLRSQFASGVTTDQLIIFTNEEIMKDLLSAQTQPELMANYRRFVVIRANSENTIPINKDGAEWLTLSQFSFKDDYFRP